MEMLILRIFSAFQSNEYHEYLSNRGFNDILQILTVCLKVKEEVKDLWHICTISDLLDLKLRKDLPTLTYILFSPTQGPPNCNLPSVPANLGGPSMGGTPCDWLRWGHMKIKFEEWWSTLAYCSYITVIHGSGYKFCIWQFSSLAAKGRKIHIVLDIYVI